MPVAEAMMALDDVVTQPWRERGLPAMRRKVEGRLVEGHDRIVDQACGEGARA